MEDSSAALVVHSLVWHVIQRCFIFELAAQTRIVSGWHSIGVAGADEWESSEKGAAIFESDSI